MNKAGLLKEISKAITKLKAEELAAVASGYHTLVRELLDLTFYPKSEVAFRAAWILEIIALKHSNTFKQETAYFISRYPEQRYQSCRRHFTTIMTHITCNKKYADQLVKTDMEPIVESSFEWMIDPLSAVAVQANCMDVLFNLQKNYHWIADELRAQVQFLMRDGGAAIQSRGKAILSKMSV